MEEKIAASIRSLSAFFVFCFLLTSCAGPAPALPTIPGPTITPDPGATVTPTFFGPSADFPTSVPSDTPSLPTQTLIPPTVTPAPMPTYTAASTPPSLPAAYLLDVVLDVGAHTASVDETITYQNSAGVALDTLVLAVEPNLWKNCYLQNSLMVNGQEINDADLSSDRLEIPLLAPLAPGGTLNLSLYFDLHLPPADDYHIFGYNNLQTNLVNWYPFIVPYDSEQGWLLHPPAEVGEHLVYDAVSFDVTLHLVNSGGTVIVAASAPAEALSDGWHYQLEEARTFALSIGAEYETASTTANGVTVTSYFSPAERVEGQAVLDNVAKALTTFETLFGPDPYPSLSIVESPYYDGMEYDGLFFLSRDFYEDYDGTVLNDLIDIAVHETAHQWWFGSVGSDQALEPWLDEALATYSERLFYEQNYPQVTAWQDFRIAAFGPAGWVNTDIYHGEDFRSYANAVYLRGARFLQTVRLRIGDEAFFAFLKDYAAQMSGQRATAADFFRILHEHSEADIADIVSEYFK